MTDTCGKKPLSGLGVCVLDAGHKSDHQDDTGRSWPSSKKNRVPLAALGAIKRRSEKQVVRTDFLMGVKAERLRAQIEQRGDPFCEECGRLASDPYMVDALEYGDDEYLELCMSMLDLDHIKNRSQGRPYKGPQDHGIDSPLNLRLLCRPCHERKTGVPFQKETP